MGVSNIRQGYSSFQSFWSGIAFALGIFTLFRKFNDTRGSMADVDAECEHGEIILDQVNAMLRDSDVIGYMTSDQDGRKLLRSVRNTRDNIASRIHDLRLMRRKYDHDNVSFTSKIRFAISDKTRMDDLRNYLKRDLRDIQDLIVWIDHSRRD